MKKICFVVQRYGLEVNGGAELLTRQLAEKMVGRYDVTVLTSKAIDYTTWRNEYEADEETINGVTVKRFAVVKERNQQEFDEINGRFMRGELSESEEDEWIEKQGPFVPDLIEYIKKNKDEYDAFLFCTYLYYPTVMGLRVAGDKGILLGHAHDEPFLKMKAYREVFNSPMFFFFNTDEERALVRKKFANYRIPYMLGGAGVDVPESVDANRFKEKYGLDDYIIYVGRIDEGKNCPEMFEFFNRFKKNHNSNLKLVLMGKPAMDIPKSDDIISLGFVDEQDKFDGIAGAKFLLLPSIYESLSIVVLEAFCLNIPVLVNERCEVLKGHIDKSGGGYYYSGYYGFEASMLKLLLHDDIRTEMGCKGKKYVDNNFQWETIIRKLSLLIEKI